MTGTARKPTYHDLLSDLKKFNQEKNFDVYVPSIGKNVKFKPLTVKQQKELIKSGIDQRVQNLSFVTLLNNIITDNLVDNGATISTIDKSPIMIALRANSLPGELKLTVNDEDVLIDIHTHVKSFSKHKFPEKKKTFTVSKGPIEVDGSIPTIDEDTVINKTFKKTFGGQKGDEQDIVITTIGEIFVYELVKYISKIRFAVEGQDQTEVDFKTLPPKQMVELFETLPMSISQLLINKVNEFKEFDSNFLTVMGPEGEVTIPVDVTLFASE